jgi:hypothetical protein
MPKKTDTAPKAAKVAMNPTPLGIPDDLKAEVKKVASIVHLSEQETMRQALRRGLPILEKILAAA